MPAIFGTFARFVVGVLAGMLIIGAAEQVMSTVAQSSSPGPQPQPLYTSPGLPINDRVADLVSRMNMDEKVNQLVLPFGAKFPHDYVEAGFNTSGLGGT